MAQNNSIFGSKISSKIVKNGSKIEKIQHKNNLLKNDTLLIIPTNQHIENTLSFEKKLFDPQVKRFREYFLQINM